MNPKDILNAVLDTRHEIDADKVVLYYNYKQMGRNALSQLDERIKEVIKQTKQNNFWYTV